MSRVERASLAALSTLLLWTLSICQSSAKPLKASLSDAAITPRSLAMDDVSASPLLRVIEVDPPVRFDEASGTSSCEETLVTYSFANSYGKPYVGPYEPPSCQFNRVTWNLTVVSAGRQFDRLGTVSLGDIEVFRTSTAEPTQSGIIWTYIKDMSSYITLFKEQQTIIFDLGNIMNNIYTGAYNVTLTATYYNVNSHKPAADIILPVSRGLKDASSAFTTPQQNATSAFAIPKNCTRAIFTLAATGQSNEEFWWSNVLQRDVNDFPADGTIPGYSPFREVQLYIDGKLAGVAWPFPVIFTGGVVPGLWRPIVGIDAFDLKENEIDVTAWLPYLSDGKTHEYSIKVSGLVQSPDGKTVLSETTDTYWIVTGKLFLWLGPSSIQPSGPPPVLLALPPSIQATSQFHNKTNPNITALDYSVTVTREITVSDSVVSSTGINPAIWHQALQFNAVGRYSEGGNLQYNYLHTTGQDTSSSGYCRNISYLLNATTLQTTDGDNFTIAATVDRVQDIGIFGPSVFPTGLESWSSMVPPGSGSSLNNVQNGAATYIANSTASTSFSFGETSQQLTFSAVQPGTNAQTQLYYRDITADNGTIVSDQRTDKGQNDQPVTVQQVTPVDLWTYALVKQDGTGEDVPTN